MFKDKACKKCLVVQPMDSFYARPNGKRHHACKTCMVKKNSNLSPEQLLRRRDTMQKHREAMNAGLKPHLGYELIRQAKAQPCKDCGGSFPEECMDFDHMDPALKIKPVSAMKHYSKEKIAAEIAKCEVICSNCHRIRTKKRANGEELVMRLAVPTDA